MVIGNGLTLEEAIRAEIADFRAKQKHAQEKMKQAELEMKQAELEAKSLGEYVDWMEQGLERRKKLTTTLYYNGHKPLDVDEFLKQSTWTNLKAIMDGNKGILVVNDSVSFLVDMKVFSDREQARHSIYSTIHNHRNDLDKIRQGIYRLKGANKPCYDGDIPNENKPSLNNPMGFKSGVAKVLQDALGEALERTEIWKRMQAIGIRSHSINPLGWVDWSAHQCHAKKVSPHTWRWEDSHLESTKQVAQSELSLLPQSSTTDDIPI